MCVCNSQAKQIMHQESHGMFLHTYPSSDVIIRLSKSIMIYYCANIRNQKGHESCCGCFSPLTTDLFFFQSNVHLHTELAGCSFVVFLIGLLNVSSPSFVLFCSLNFAHITSQWLKATKTRVHAGVSTYNFYTLYLSLPYYNRLRFIYSLNLVSIMW